ncbi:hypothetical protein ABMA58_21220, partial [Oceanospirillum sp. HFRX-1_2]
MSVDPDSMYNKKLRQAYIATLVLCMPRSFVLQQNALRNIFRWAWRNTKRKFMGKIFDLIADEALKISDYSDECSFCGNKGVPIYDITGFQIEPGKYLFEDVPDDMQDTEKDDACENCIKSGTIKLFSEWEVENVLK